MFKIVTPEFIVKQIEEYYCYSDARLDDYGCVHGDVEDILDIDYMADLCMGFDIGGVTIEENDILYWDMIDTLNTMDLDELYGYISDLEDRLSYDPWREHCDADFYGV